ncbi:MULTISPECIES: Uma2 family endonuclease [Cyanophyceae]|uniref:Uma2 family endonuclease n=1 Tax=Leptolyngbya subtilissima DQ-A4 TaxID=2933933 RepID=A0ABV0KBT1_9CYAN|nr:Uma2 family endonuclease [Nodosilinea sp. FACHB-141]MBD2111760.1 Uma2 family endonuclease [Nodosilinea sp. FACHB-141]
MSPAQDPATALYAEESVTFPPSNLYSDEPPLETDLHRDQIDLLIRLLRWHWQNRQDVYVSGNVTIYYSPKQRKSRDFKGPDFFVVLNSDPQPRRSWVVWDEDGKYPNVIVELLSESTAAVDRGLKKQLYQDVFRTPEYFWFDPESFEFQGFALLRGHYAAITPDSHGRLWSEELDLFLGIHENQLRFFTSDGTLILSPEETAQAEQQRANRLADKLRSLGIDPNEP